MENLISKKLNELETVNTKSNTESKNIIRHVEFSDDFPIVDLDNVKEIVNAELKKEFSIDLEMRTWAIGGKDVDIIFVDAGNGWAKLWYLVPHQNTSTEKVCQILLKFETLCQRKSNL